MKVQSTIASEIENVDLNITVTMPIRQWRQIIRQLPIEHPSSEFKMLVRDTIDKVLQAVDQQSATKTPEPED